MNYERLQLLVDLHKILSKNYIENQHQIKAIETIIADNIPFNVPAS